MSLPDERTESIYLMFTELELSSLIENSICLRILLKLCLLFLANRGYSKLKAKWQMGSIINGVFNTNVI